MNTVSTVDFSPEQAYPGKGLAYDWRSVIAEVESALLDAELASLTSVYSD
jgi:hypothetical protein